MKGLENSLVQDLKITLLCNVQRSGVTLRCNFGIVTQLASLHV